MISLKLDPQFVLVGILLLSSLLSLCLVAGEATNGNGGTVCPPDDEVCPQDTLGYEAISRLHQQVDDDKNGKLEWEESDEFMREELKYEDNFDRQARFHGSDDHISVQELWKLWTSSSVYNWTADEVVDWLVECVELPQYTDNFLVNEVRGRILPRLAANGQYQTMILGIKSSVHRQKISVKATDAVLFGPPKKAHNYLKDVALVASLVIAVGGCWLAYVQHKYSQRHIQKVVKDLDNLQKAEDALIKLQKKLEDAENEQRSVAEEKKKLERKLSHEVHTAKTEAERLRVTREATEEEISRLKLAEEELVQVRMALQEAEMQLDEVEHSGPLPELQQWLQLTYEIESKQYEAKREAAEVQLCVAKEMCEKIRRKRSAFLGSIRVAHTTSIDDTDSKILSARSALEEIKLDLQERSQRWRQIETICGFNIITNPGLQYLESLLRGVNQARSYLTRNASSSVLAPVSLDEADEDVPPGASTAQAMPMMSGTDLRQRTVGLGGSYPSTTSVNSAPLTHNPLRPQLRGRTSSMLSRPSLNHVTSQRLPDETANHVVSSQNSNTDSLSSHTDRDSETDDTSQKKEDVRFDLGPSQSKLADKKEEETSYKKSRSFDSELSAKQNGQAKSLSLSPSFSESALRDKSLSQDKTCQLKENAGTEETKEESSSYGDSTDSTSVTEVTQHSTKKKKLFRLFKDGVKKKSA